MGRPDGTPTIAVLGTGLMGFPMARRLADAGLHVRVWNRTRVKAQPLAEHGAVVADTPAEAVAGADFVLTMLLDADAVAAAMEGPHGAISSIHNGEIWVQMSTVGEEGWRRLCGIAERRGIGFVDAPVLGTRKPAEEGKLRILASGPPELLDRCAVLWPPLGVPLEGLGAAGNGSRLKLAVNAWVLALADATASSIELAERLRLDGKLFLDAIDGSPTDSPYAHLKSAAMLKGDYSVSFSVGAAAKDARLVAEAAAGVGADTALIEAIEAHLCAAAEAGHADDDLAAVYVAHRG